MVEFDNKMLKINRLERNFASINHKIDKKYNRIICNFDSHCYFPATYKLITGIGKYPNYTETMICDKCSNHINKLNCYQLDIIDFVDLYKL